MEIKPTAGYEQEWGKADMMSVIALMPPKRGAEIGVYNGDTSVFFLNTFPKLELYLVDPWLELSKEEYEDDIKDSQAVMDARYNLVKTITAPYPNVHIIRKRSMEALADIEDESLDFVYIDANHELEHVKQDIDGWWKKVRPGGLVMGHDYDILHFGVLNGIAHAIQTYHPSKFIVLRHSRDWMFTK